VGGAAPADPLAPAFAPRELAVRRLGGSGAAFDRRFFSFPRERAPAAAALGRGVVVAGAPATDSYVFLASYALAPIPVSFDSGRARPARVGGRLLQLEAAGGRARDGAGPRGVPDGARSLTAFLVSVLRVAGVSRPRRPRLARGPRARPGLARASRRAAAWSVALGCGLIGAMVPLSLLVRVHPGWPAFLVLAAAAVLVCRRLGAPAPASREAAEGARRDAAAAAPRSGRWSRRASRPTRCAP
jgi:hypothetical protein